MIALGPLGACASGPTGPEIGRLPTITSEDPEAEAALDKARMARSGGNATLAEARYRTFIKQHPGDPLVPVAQLELGRLLLDAGQTAEARGLFEIVSQHSQRALAEQGRFYGAVAAHREGDSRTAVRVLRGMVGRTIDPSDTVLLLSTLADAELATGDLTDAAMRLDELATAAVPQSDQRAAEEELGQLIAERATSQEIETLIRELPQDGPGFAMAMGRAVRDAQARNDTERTRELVEQMSAAGIALDDELEEIAVRASQSGEADPRSVGAILSLTGRGRKLGEQALRGLMLAAGLPPKGPPTADTPRLVFRDDGGDAARAAAAVDELVSVHRVIAIIGPMGGDAARAAAERAEALGVPLIVLTPSAGLVDPSRPVFQVMPTALAEVTALVDRAAAEGQRRFALMAPEGNYGDTMASVYRQAVQGRGGTVVASRRYARDATAFGQDVAALVAAEPDAILIADTPTRLAMIAPALAAAGLWSGGPGADAAPDGRIVQLLAPAVAFDHSAVARSARYLQGALFAVPFDPVTASGAGRDFVARYEAEYDTSPNSFAALAHDAYELVAVAADGSGGDRETVVERLRQVRSQALAGPAEGFARDGSLAIPTRLLRYGPDGFTELAR